MPRSPRSGLNVVRAKRADGSVVEYFYDIKTKAFLGHDREKAKARALGYTIADDTISGLIAFYKDSDAFKKRKPRTQALYEHYLGQLATMFGDLPASAIRPSTVEMLKQATASQPSRCNMLLAMLRIILGIAHRLEYVSSNVALRPGRITVAPRTEVWSVTDETAFLEHAHSLELRIAFMLLLYTVQRPSDVLAMQLNRISERNGRMFIALRQAKTGALLDVPVHTRLEPLLRERLSSAGDLDKPIVESPRGFVWSRRNFSRAWDKVTGRAAISGLQRRDLRRTGIVRLAEAGATTPMIAAVSGHGIDYCQRIIDTYLPRRTEVAIQGIELWERAGTYQESKVVELASRRRKG